MGIFPISAHFTVLFHSSQNMVISAAFEVALFITVLTLRDVNIFLCITN
jgi:hypothetical protein